MPEVTAGCPSWQWLEQGRWGDLPRCPIPVLLPPGHSLSPPLSQGARHLLLCRGCWLCPRGLAHGALTEDGRGEKWVRWWPLPTELRAAAAARLCAGGPPVGTSPAPWHPLDALVLRGWQHRPPCFTGEETETQRGQGASPGSHSWEGTGGRQLGLFPAAPRSSGQAAAPLSPRPASAPPPLPQPQRTQLDSCPPPPGSQKDPHDSEVPGPFKVAEAFAEMTSYVDTWHFTQIQPLGLVWWQLVRARAPVPPLRSKCL